MLISGLFLGIILGFVFQRGRFCVTGAFRDVWLSNSTRWLTAFGLAILVQAVLVIPALNAGLIKAEAPDLAIWAVAGGSLLFGIGIVLAGGCATGTYYRSGEGLIGSWIALIFYALLSNVMKYGLLKDVTETARSQKTGLTTINETLGVSPYVLLLVLAVAVGLGLWRQASIKTATVAAPPARRSGLARLLFERPWNPFVTATIVGLLAALAYPLSNATGRNSGLGITTPSADIVSLLTTGDLSRINWGVLLVIGLIPGSFIAAKASGEFRLRVPDALTTLRAIGGGTLMGIGASLAGGCTIGNSLVQTALFSWQGWVAFLFTFLGVGVGAKLFITNHKRVGAKPVLVTSTRTEELVSA